MTMFSAVVISIMSPLIVMFMFFSWRETDRNKPIRQRVKEVLVELIKLALMVMASMTISSVAFKVAIHFVS